VSWLGISQKDKKRKQNFSVIKLILYFLIPEKMEKRQESRFEGDK